MSVKEKKKLLYNIAEMLAKDDTHVNVIEHVMRN